MPRKSKKLPNRTLYRRLIPFVILLVILLSLLVTTWQFRSNTAPSRSEAAVDAIPSTILNGLRSGGVNLQFGWYDPYNGNRNEFDDDLPIIKSKGGGHVRLPLSMDSIESGTTGRVNNTRWAELVSFVNKAKSNGLVTIIDVHNTHFREANGVWNENYMEAIANSSVRSRHLSLLTEIAAKTYAELDRNWVVLQPGNEPINITEVWRAHQRQLIPSMRRACPDCVIFAISGNDWQGVGSTIRFLDPTGADSFWWDRRIMVDMHMYAPLSLSHCHYPGQANNCPGKTWPGNYSDWTPVTGVMHSGTWNKAFLESQLNALWDWKTRHNVEVHFSEIGTAGALVDSVRAAYLRDVTDIFRAHGAGWSCYEWDKNFGMYPNHPQTISACFRGSPGVTVPPTTPGSATARPTPTSISATIRPTATPTNTSRPTPTPPGGVGQGLRGEYFDNETLGFSSLKFTRTDPQVNFNWGAGSPGNGIDSDTFSARWTGEVYAPVTGWYGFSTRNDDGVILHVNNKLQLWDWWTHTVKENGSAIYLEAGQKYPIKLEYFESTGDAVIELYWTVPGKSKEIIPAQYLSSGGVPTPTSTPVGTNRPTPTSISTNRPTPTPVTGPAGNGLIGTYYNNADFTSLAFARIDPTINFNWHVISPDIAKMSRDTFSIEWTGFIQAPRSGNHTLFTQADDGVRMWIDNRLVIDNWQDQSFTERWTKVNMQAGVKYPIKIQYYENTGMSAMKLWWWLEGGSKEIIPANYLFTQ